MSNYNLLTLKKNLKKDFTSLKSIRFALLGDSATQLMAQALKGYGYECQLNFEIFEADYNQIDLQINHPGSELYESQPEYILIHKTSQKLLLSYYEAIEKEKSGLADVLLQKMEQYISTLNQRTSARIIISSFPEINDGLFGNYAARTNVSFLYQIRKLNFGLMELAQRYENVFILDVALLQHQYGVEYAHDRKVYINSSMPESLDFLPLIAKHITDIVQAISGKFKKCLILDLDNTCWGGVIGDDGMEGIQIGSLGMGKAFTELQLWAKNLTQRGIILAICSKNTEHIAKEPFEKHPEMVLRLDDVAIFVANWENKADNIRYIQRVLNIGFDSMVFLDDNPFERNLVRSEIPQVTVPELPEDPAEYLPFVNKLNLFETASYSKEDAKRTQKYQQEAQRVQLKQNFQSIDDYLQSLSMTGTFKAFDEFHLPRISQLSLRSNQFNLRTVRYDEQQIRNIMQASDRAGFYISLQDKFGEYGLISILIVDTGADEWFIDTWIMSCRVLKRDVEKFVLNQLVETARVAGAKRITGEYIPTPKNALVKDHYAQLGFKEESGKWVLEIGGFQPFRHFIKQHP